MVKLWHLSIEVKKGPPGLPVVSKVQQKPNDLSLERIMVVLFAWNQILLSNRPTITDLNSVRFPSKKVQPMDKDIKMILVIRDIRWLIGNKSQTKTWLSRVDKAIHTKRSKQNTQDGHLACLMILPLTLISISTLCRKEKPVEWLIVQCTFLREQGLTHRLRRQVQVSQKRQKKVLTSSMNRLKDWDIDQKSTVSSS